MFDFLWSIFTWFKIYIVKDIWRTSFLDACFFPPTFCSFLGLQIICWIYKFFQTYYWLKLFWHDFANMAIFKIPSAFFPAKECYHIQVHYSLYIHLCKHVFISCYETVCFFFQLAQKYFFSPTYQSFSDEKGKNAHFHLCFAFCKLLCKNLFCSNQPLQNKLQMP